jgi:hypothetical protein
VLVELVLAVLALLAVLAAQPRVRMGLLATT